MWDCLEIVATFLSEIQLALKDELSQSSVQEVQEILMNALRPFGIPTSTLDTVEVKVLQNDMRDLGGMGCKYRRIFCFVIFSGVSLPFAV